MKTKTWRFIKLLLFGTGIFFAISFIFNVVIDHDFSQKAFLQAFTNGLINGFIFGLLWPYGRKVFYGSNYEKINVDKLLEADEHIVYQSPAIHIKTFDNINGKLTLTNRRLIFIADRWKKVPNPVIPINEIKEVRKRKTFGMFPTGVNFYTHSGKKVKFIVDDWDEWIRVLDRQSSMMAV